MDGMWIYIMQKAWIKLAPVQQLKCLLLLMCVVLSLIRNTEGKKKNCNQWDKLTIFKNNLLVFMYKEKIK